VSLYSCNTQSLYTNICCTHRIKKEITVFIRVQVAFFCTKNSPKKSGATYARGATCACTLLLCACHLGSDLHLHACACMRMRWQSQVKGKLDRDKLFENSACSDFGGF